MPELSRFYGIGIMMYRNDHPPAHFRAAYSREEAHIGILECNERDAAHVLDGPLYHESELEPEEHYTDTHGYTECNFAAFATGLGKRFCPCIRGLKKQRIYHADPERGYGALGDMLSGSRRRLRLDWIEKHWDEIAQLVASFAYGLRTRKKKFVR
jgi:TnpA family transposase